MYLGDKQTLSIRLSDCLTSNVQHEYTLQHDFTLAQSVLIHSYSYSFSFVLIHYIFSLFIMMWPYKCFIVDSNKCCTNESSPPTTMRVISFEATGFLETIQFYLSTLLYSLSSHLLFTIIRARPYTHSSPHFYLSSLPYLLGRSLMHAYVRAVSIYKSNSS